MRLGCEARNDSTTSPLGRGVVHFKVVMSGNEQKQ